MTDKVSIRRLPTGVPGFDAVLGGGLPEFSFNVIAGAPGAGKTTLAQQIMFALATPERPALFFTVLGEPPLKMLRYQQQYEFFDLAKVNESVRFISLAKEASSGLDGVLKRVVREVEATPPAIVIVDSFRSVVQIPKAQIGQLDLQSFIQQLGIQLTGWQATTFLIGDLELGVIDDHPVFTIADGLVSLNQSIDRNSMVRKMQVVKMRGQAPIPGLHTFRISDRGIQVFPRIILGASELPSVDEAGKAIRRPLSTGVSRLDEMLGGGIPAGYSVLVTGPSGSGKTVLAMQFIREGIRRREPGVIAVFEKNPGKYAQASGVGLDQAVRDGHVGLIHTRPLDLSIDEALHELATAVDRLKARRVVIDSLSGLELALAPTFREDFRESLYRLVSALTGMGLTVMMTAELEDCYTELKFSPHGTAFLTDAIIMQRYLEIEGQLKRVMAVVKVRGSAHEKHLRLFDVSADGIVVGDPIPDYEGILTASPHLISPGHRRPVRRQSARRRKL